MTLVYKGHEWRGGDARSGNIHQLTCITCGKTVDNAKNISKAGPCREQVSPLEWFSIQDREQYYKDELKKAKNKLSKIREAVVPFASYIVTRDTNRISRLIPETLISTVTGKDGKAEIMLSDIENLLKESFR